MRWNGEIKSRAPTRDAVSLELHPFYGIYCHRDVCSLREKLFGSTLRSNCHVLLVNAAWKICSRNRLLSSRAITNRSRAEENIRLDMNIAECHLNCCGCVGVDARIKLWRELMLIFISKSNFKFKFSLRSRMDAFRSGACSANLKVYEQAVQREGS